ncbi:NIPSNAP family protein [Methylobacterium sp. WL30]|uniref:NIPSNAP family protein n=1 Tax=unclassified Methylobacterium TaxID=2615210 RepID=UPI0011C80238|nr:MULTISPECIES: NIPSNAP family protein [unclassified Methylobacterium]TXM87621.1 NIPSNAP family protein [Methylobacterium sp. WL116]TXN33484.1 NIPSNAP family protein [Methylobacterium sp. WL93]TXN45905.1 NIPSNAP family protein [Methylobacterium sp. WL119]TXN63629.1 NIPSNAP family protein [Methylobacterium sp. WL30]
MLYELAALSCPLNALDRASEGAAAWVGAPEAGGSVLGSWRTEIGMLGRLLVLRGFEAPEAMSAERRRALMCASPLNAGGVATALEMDSYAAFPFLPPVRTGARGGVYEFRTYRLKPGGLPPTLDAWEAAVPPAKPYTDHLVTNLYALDGAPRITHIWGFPSLGERASLRRAVQGSGHWPPKGGPDHIAEAVSSIGLPEAWSPLT